MPGGRIPFAVANVQMLFIKPKPRDNNNSNWLVTVVQKAETKLPHRDKKGIRDSKSGREW